MKFKGAPNSLILRRQHETNNFETRCDYEIEVAKLTNTLWNNLEDDARNQHAPQSSHIRIREAYGELKLEKISGLCGYVTSHATEKKETYEEYQEYLRDRHVVFAEISWN